MIDEYPHLASILFPEDSFGYNFKRFFLWLSGTSTIFRFISYPLHPHPQMICKLFSSCYNQALVVLL